MNFLTLPKTVRDLIAAHASFSADAATTVLLDYGHAKPLREKALASKGYCVEVWPPMRGDSDSEVAGISGVLTTLVVRVSFEPQTVTAQANPDSWVNQKLIDVIDAVLSAEPDAGGVRFQLAPDAFELMNFDEGVLAFHLRFQRLAVFS